MAVRTITTLGNPVLRVHTKPMDAVAVVSVSTKRLVRDLIDTVIEAEGLGIAAPQIGSTERVAIINGKDGPFPIINPRILKRSIRTETDEEGCLSIPGVFGLVRRAKKITVTYLDFDGTRHTDTPSGLLARVFQHEIDHLDGVLFIDRTKKITKGTLP